MRLAVDQVFTNVFFLSAGAWTAACWSGLLAWDAFYVHRWEMLASACALGLVFSAVIVFPRRQ